ncbi:hypothetical protein P154DRAFT_527709 [Amniculicola lignicola CBS 123094]|uniref:Transcription factor domain-containing protein n=1 Tax=Amniculicola lignicola CBS 123094 TaxID=1392246 RepID=A0A6A5VXB2_9PLEO|nr:hypothetical protein P154DRAFT_527709 [Amniculicola lignicola CBS 123094]
MASTSTFDWQSPPPSLALDTALTDAEIDLASFSAGTVPAIAISQCEQIPRVISPSSPVPSFWSGTTRASSPERLSNMATPIPPALPLQPTSKPYSPSTAPDSTQFWEFMGQQDSPSHLKPDASEESRRSSVSSSSFDSDEAGGEDNSDIDVLPLAPVPHLPRQGIFAPATDVPSRGSSISRASFTDRNRAITTTPLPSRFEAETLTTEFIQHIETLGHSPYTMNPALFAKFCETVYPDPNSRSSSVDTSVSVPMARFHVFMAMAIGMKVRIRNSTEATNTLLDRCYELAMQQATSVTFWQELGGIEAVQLLGIMAAVKKDASFEPRPLQPSFSW